MEDAGIGLWRALRGSGEAARSCHQEADHGGAGNNKVNEIAKEPEALSFLPPAEMMLSVDPADPEFRSYDEHLYVDATGHFVAKLNSRNTRLSKRKLHAPM